MKLLIEYDAHVGNIHVPAEMEPVFMSAMGLRSTAQAVCAMFQRCSCFCIEYVSMKSPTSTSFLVSRTVRNGSNLSVLILSV
jgi:hypothetical protein